MAKKANKEKAVEIVADNIKYYLNDNTPYWLAQKSGISSATLSRILSHTINVSVDTLEAIAKGLGVPMSYLLLTKNQDAKANSDIPADLLERLRGRETYVYLGVRSFLDALDQAKK